VPHWRGTTGGGTKRERGLFAKLKAKDAKVNIAIHPLIPPPAGDTLKLTFKKELDLNVPLWRGTKEGGAKRERGLFAKPKAKVTKANISIHPPYSPASGGY
jgi:hypothetical protein